MSQVPRIKIESVLPTKGFVVEESKDRYYFFEYNGKRTGIYTWTSRGSGYKTYGIELLKVMKKFLKLDTLAELRDLLNCPMSKQQYEAKLKNKGLI